MGGTGLGLGSMGSYGSTLGYGATGGGSPSANTTAAVTNPGTGKLEAYDPTTMTTQTKAPTARLPDVLGAGMSSSGVPDFVSNWLSTGGTGTLPTATTATIASQGVSTPGELLKPIGAPKKAATGAEAIKAGQIKAPVAAKAAATPAAAVAKAPLTQVGGNSGQQPLYVNDQWNFQTGTSQPMATMAPGGPMANQGGQAPFWTDGKGNYFFDAQGTKPVTGAVVQQLKNMWG